MCGLRLQRVKKDTGLPIALYISRITFKLYPKLPPGPWIVQMQLELDLESNNELGSSLIPLDGEGVRVLQLMGFDVPEVLANKLECIDLPLRVELHCR